MRSPPDSKAPKARTISHMVTAWLPSAIDGNGSMSLVMPKRFASAITRSSLLSCASCAATVLVERASASLSVIGPR